MQTISLPLTSILSRVQERRYQIPQFQRPFRWKVNQVKLLVDSIARGYPIGSILLLQKNEFLPLRSRDLEAAINEDRELPFQEEESPPDIFYVLDGQQRLTSITRVFLDADRQKAFYFDLREMANAFEAKSGERDIDWIVSKTRGRREQERRGDNRYLRTDVALDQQKCDVYVSEYIEDSEDFKDFDKRERRNMAARVKGHFERIRNYQVPFIIIEPNVGVESICRVFETINSTGTRLTTFDLAVARFFPELDLKEKKDAAFERFPILQNYKIDGDRILQVISLVKAAQEDRKPEPTRSELLNLPKDFIATHWEKAASALADTLEWAESHGARPDTLPNIGVLVALAGFFCLFPKDLINIRTSMNPAIRRWYFTRLLRPGARAAANWQIGNDFLDLYEYRTAGKALTFFDVIMDKSILKDISDQDNRFKAIQCIMFMETREDLLTGQILSQNVEEHHIFPKATVARRGNKKLVDTILNRLPVSVSTNRQLRDEEPRKYLGDLAERMKSQGMTANLKKRLRNCLIPWYDKIEEPDFRERFSVSNFENFLDSRADLLLEKIAEVVGASLIIKSDVRVDEDQDQFDDPSSED